MLLAAARGLATHRNFDGTVSPVFQPAEEGGGGAREMIKDGLFERFPMEAIFGAQLGRAWRQGSSRSKAGRCLPPSNEFRITLRGGAAAMPPCRTWAWTQCRPPASWCRASRPSSAATSGHRPASSPSP